MSGLSRTPELHLHPRAQDQLADVFLHAANAGRRAIIESHSEVFLLRLAKRIDTHEWSARMAANVQVMSESLRADADGMRIYYFFPDPDRGTVVLPIRFAPDGSLIDNWPNGLFENDWTSGLDRLKLFCGAADAEQAGKQWPWIAQIEDPSVRRWLAGCWLTTKMGPGQDRDVRSVRSKDCREGSRGAAAPSIGHSQRERMPREFYRGVG